MKNWQQVEPDWQTAGWFGWPTNNLTLKPTDWLTADYNQRNHLRPVRRSQLHRQAHCLARAAIVKIVKNGRLAALLEVQLRKICTTLWRESGLEVKTVKAESQDVFGGSSCFWRGRRNDFDTLQNTGQAQELGLQKRWHAWWIWRGPKWCFSRGKRRDLPGFLKSMFDASDAESVERVQISCHGSVTLQGSFRVAVTGVRMPRLNFLVARAILGAEVKSTQPALSQPTPCAHAFSVKLTHLCKANPVWAKHHVSRIPACAHHFESTLLKTGRLNLPT